MAKNALAKKSSTAITKWDEELARYATEAGETAKAATGSFISVRAGVLSIDGQPVKDNKLSVIALDWVYENVYYDESFDADNQTPPACFAFGPRDERGFSTEEGMTPHEDVIEAQHDQCRGCEKNEFGSAEKGKGKACSNRVRLALLSGDLLNKESIESGDVRYYKVSVTSTAGWWNFVRGVRDNFKRPPFGVVTELKVVPDPKTQFKTMFNFIDKVPDELIGSIIKRREAQLGVTAFPYAKVVREEAPKKQAKKQRRF